MKHISTLFVGAGMIMLAASCGSMEADTETAQGFLNCYAIVTDIQKGTVTVSTPVTVGLTLNWTQSTAEASLTGLVIDGTIYPQMILTDMKWEPTKDNLWGHTTNNPFATLATGISPVLSDFKFQWSDRMDIPELEPYEYDPAFVYGFVIDGRYRIEGSRTPFNFWGTTTATSDDVEPFTSGVNNIVATPDFKNMTMTVLVTGAQFAQGMPALNIQLDNIPLKLVNDGASFSFEADELTPTISGTPYPNYPCSNIKGTLDPKTGMTFSFDCNVMQRKVYTVTTNPTVFGYR